MTERAIEIDADALLSEFARARGVKIAAPIPIDDIIEKHLKIGIEFDNTHQLFGVPQMSSRLDPDILGAIFFEQKRIVVDESLDPDAYPNKEGRYRYTAAHEVGHWRLHRQLFGDDPRQSSMFAEAAPASMVCRSSQAKARIEVQADLYASFLLMPRTLVLAAWYEVYPDRKPRLLQPCEPIQHPFVEIPHSSLRRGDVTIAEIDNHALENVAKPFAEKFLVSPIAMRIRLEQMGLLYRAVPLQPFLSDGTDPLF